MVVLITGGTGFIGPYLTEKILNETNEQIILYDYAPNKNKIRDFLEKVVLVQGDILDLEKLEETVKEYDVTRLVHLASIPPPVSEEHPLKGIRINCEGTANIFEMGRIFNLERIVYVSSASVNGPQSLYGQKVLTEEDKHSPVLCYGVGKAFNENLTSFYHRKYEVDIVGLKPIMRARARR